MNCPLLAFQLFMNETHDSDEQMSQEGDDDGQLLFHFTNTIRTNYLLMRYYYSDAHI